MLNDCILATQAPKDDGYVQVVVDGKRVYAHRLALANKLGVPVFGLVGVALHSCDVRNCINPEHLSLGTQKDNIQDMISKGRGLQSGSKANPAKLTDKDVAYIRAHYVRRAPGIKGNGSELAKLFNLSPPALYKVVRNITYKVEGNYVPN